MQASFSAFISYACEATASGLPLRYSPMSPNRRESVTQMSSLWRQTVIESP
jgi:hypothetical protein